MGTAAARTEPQQTPGTAVATTDKAPSAVAARVDARVAELRERNKLVQAIRGTAWGKDVSQDVALAVAHYCNTNGLDAVRHVEVLGGRIYLTAAFYEERAAPLLMSGQVRKDEPLHINADPRLEDAAKAGEAWAVEERTRRLQLRIRYNVPEKAAAAVVQRLHIEGGGTIVGVNWCGGGSRQRDLVGDTEPTKTAETRAARRAWKQIAEVVPAYGAQVKPIQAAAKMASESMPVAVVEAESGPKALMSGNSEDPYDLGAAVNTAPIPPAQHSDDPAQTAEDTELALDDLKPMRRGRDALREG